ncbi:MAG: chromate efflux transporter [Micavibrio sp.]|nr:MAG: chromate efflux transporter [Micavibrio sp.]
MQGRKLLTANLNFREFFAVWLKIGLLSFGGPAGQIALMHRILVEEKKWISDNRFLHALNYCMLLPGPEAMQLAAYTGWLLRGIRGGLIAGLLFILPGALIVYILTLVYVMFHGVSYVEAAFLGIKAGVLAIVLQAVFRLGKKILKTARYIVLAVLSFCALYFFALPFPLIILMAALAGCVIAAQENQPSAEQTVEEKKTEQKKSHLLYRMSAVLALLWLLPLAIILPLAGTDSVYFDIYKFFSKMAIVTFGGAYAVLTYMTQQAVEYYAWLAPGEMVDGLGLAETTPGPLILVTQFVGFFAAFRNPGILDPFLAGSLGTLLVVWVTFVPCFLWIFLGAPWMEKLESNPRLSGAMQGITAAVTGVIAHLALWFALHTLFSETLRPEFGVAGALIPVWESWQPAVFIFFLVSCLVLFVLRLGILPLIGVMAAAGCGLHFVQNLLL